MHISVEKKGKKQKKNHKNKKMCSHLINEKKEKEK